MSEAVMVSGKAQIAPEWLQWMVDFRKAAERLVAEDPVEPSTPEEVELTGTKIALYARAITIFGTLILLAENDLQLDLRIHSRALIETAIYLLALDEDPSLRVRMQEDDLKSRRERAKLHRRTVEPDSEIAREIDAFLSEAQGKLKYIEVGGLLQNSNFSRLYTSYRDVSADSAHVTFSSLKEHIHVDADGDTMRFLVNPGLDELTLYVTLTEAGMSIIAATYMLMKCKEQTDTWDELKELARRYRELKGVGLSDENEPAQTT